MCSKILRPFQGHYLSHDSQQFWTRIQKHIFMVILFLNIPFGDSEQSSKICKKAVAHRAKSCLLEIVQTARLTLKRGKGKGGGGDELWTAKANQFFQRNSVLYPCWSLQHNTTVSLKTTCNHFVHSLLHARDFNDAPVHIPDLLLV